MNTVALLSVVAAVSAQQWEAVIPGGDTRCVDGRPFAFFVKRGASDKVVLDFAGGGACWDAATCLLPLYTNDVNIQGNLNMLNGQNSGILSASNPRNPFSEWTQVHVPYCTADAHAGNNTVDYGYGEFNHVGRVNSQSAIDWIVQNYRASAEVVGVTGCSAGSLGGLANAPFLFEEFPATVQKYFWGDSYVGVLAEAQYLSTLSNWGLKFAPFIPALSPENMSTWTRDIGAYITAASAEYFSRDSIWTLFSTQGDAVQGAFYALGGGTEAWTPLLRMTVSETADKVDNYASFISPGAGHCVSVSNGFYSVASTGVNLSEWVADLFSSRLVESIDCQGNGC